jgi:hypothetical protein
MFIIIMEKLKKFFFLEFHNFNWGLIYYNHAKLFDF